MELSLDIDYVLGQMEKSTQDRKLKKEWTLSEYIMHVRLSYLLYATMGLTNWHLNVAYVYPKRIGRPASSGETEDREPACCSLRRIWHYASVPL